MNATCKDRERIFEEGTAAEWAALEAHTADCAACAEDVRAWKSLSVAAKELQDYSAVPELWARIERALIEEDGRKAHRGEPKRWFSFLPAISMGWQAALAGGGVVADSNPEAEFQETVSKAKALMAAADEAVRQSSNSRGFPA